MFSRFRGEKLSIYAVRLILAVMHFRVANKIKVGGKCQRFDL